MTKFASLLSLFIMTFSVSAYTQGSEIEPATVENLNLQEFQGSYHQIAAIPQIFQSFCYRDTVASYSILENGLVRVNNQCFDKENNLREVVGRARPTTTDARLQVTFLRVFDWIWSFSGNLWIFEVSPDYSWALAGTPDRKYAWILSRSSSMDRNQLAQMATELKERNIDPCQLIMSRTESQQFAEELPTLCDYLGTASQN